MANDNFIDVTMLGALDVQRDLKRLEHNIQKKLVRSSLSKAMLPVRNLARSLAPVDKGDLKASIVRKNKTNKRGIYRSSIVTGTREELGITQNNKGYYPAAIEYGYKAQNGKHIPAKSFMRKALTDLRSSVIQNTANNIRTGIKRLK